MCDGEQVQIEAFLMSEALERLARALIDRGKSPASFSATTQSSDAGPMFKATNKVLLGISFRSWERPGLVAAFKRILSQRPNLEGRKDRLFKDLSILFVRLNWY